MRLRFIGFVFGFLWPLALSAQMWNGQDTLYGNEWIDFSKTYFKIKVAEDGIYRIGYQTLTDAGFPAGAVPAESTLAVAGACRAAASSGLASWLWPLSRGQSIAGREGIGALLDAGAAWPSTPCPPRRAARLRR